MSYRPNVLITKELNDEQLKLAEDLGLHVVMQSAIDIEYRSDWFSFQTILKTVTKPVLAFTSQNGVESFRQYIESGNDMPDYSAVYAVGEKTAEMLTEIGIDAVVPEQKNSMGLAKKLAEDFTDKKKKPNVLHLCGDKRRDEFRDFLEESDINIRDVVVYNTHLNNMELPPQQMDAILFFSPSAVQAFRQSGGFLNQKNTEFFAIGSTTGEEVSIEAGRHVNISPEPDTETLLKFVANVLGEKINLDTENAG